MRVLVESIGVLAITTVGGPTTRLHVSDAIGLRAENAEKRFRVHRARPHFHIVGLLKHAPLLYPELRELKDQVLEGQPLRPLFKFYFNFQGVSSNSGVVKRRSAFNSIHANAAALTWSTHPRMDLS